MRWNTNYPKMRTDELRCKYLENERACLELPGVKGGIERFPKEYKESYSGPCDARRLRTLIDKYVDDICGEGCTGAIAGEDSSYDSDYELDPPTKHQDVSRTTSDTLAAEYAEYVQSSADVSPGYTARVEFALKLGYTERLVQAALQKLGPSPTQNELLAELIKLGAQKGSSCDSSPPESTVDVTELQMEAIEGIQSLRPIVIDGSNVAMRVSPYGLLIPWPEKKPSPHLLDLNRCRQTHLPIS
ncbi:hypothetical protein NQ317_011931 [Molorchus minor]|uniref:Rege-1 UBA-like domain-containing protein n=1 Tax=Molorchus minor TaxID=1323400 RepID=A0ABQ9JCP5_9CUCU|nr:hypothetical protein NQ317_011931 [Molorchus minor]